MSDVVFSGSRRRFLSGTLAAAPMVGLLGMGGGLEKALAAAQPTPYEPTYFQPAEWDFVSAAVDRLIPSDDDGPGALELGVAAFIDKQMEDAYGHGGYFYMQGPFHPDAPATLGYQLRYTPREFYRAAIPEIDAWCADTYGKAFAHLDAAHRDEVLQRLEKGDADLASVPAAAFFAQLLQNTREGYFADPMYGGNKGMGAWKLIGFPGARADFMDFADQQGKVYPLGPVSIKGNKA